MVERVRLGAVLGGLCLLTTCAMADGKAVVLVYHHVATDTPASTSVTPDAFAQHLAYLEEHAFAVWPLTRALDALSANRPVPPRTVVFTFDDAYESVYTTAWPALAERGWPFTVFVATDAIDRRLAPYMSWSQLRELVEAGVELGNHGVAHRHPHDLTHAEFRVDLRRAQARIIEQTGVTPAVYAYPYGEFDEALERIVRDEGLYGVGQQSGVASSHARFTSVPRFPVSSSFAGMDDFALRVHALPLVLDVLAPPSRVLAVGDRHPRLVLESTAVAPENIDCFTEAGRALTKSMLGGPRFAIQADGRVSRGRSKYTCTSRAPSGAYAWYTHLWIAR